MFSSDLAHRHRRGAEVLGHRFAAIPDQAGITDATLHRLRHSVATFLVARGQVLQAPARLGHADAATTLREYAYALPLTDQSVADAIDQHLGTRWSRTPHRTGDCHHHPRQMRALPDSAVSATAVGTNVGPRPTRRTRDDGGDADADEGEDQRQLREPGDRDARACAAGERAAGVDDVPPCQTACPYSPSDFKGGEVHRFSLYHLLRVDDPSGLLPIDLTEITENSDAVQIAQAAEYAS
jgi:hypothetical protein